jgi:hypothetical protein
MLLELQRRSATRVEASEEFTEIKDLLVKQAEQDDVVYLAELIREREAAEDDKSSDSEDADSPGSAADAAESSTNGDSADTINEGSDGETSTSEDAAKSYTENDPEPTPQREEAIRILADLVELQESIESSWHVPQSASRSELPSSQP